ncbi:MAG TPA: hypothetical protein VK937_12080 [Candidatus Limnocylindria bacterium]|jgi:hypothetical protein|nr:hypothetical protein [Candidatus Limnocylindria bacterium]
MSPANKIVRHGIEAEKRNQQKLFDLAERLRHVKEVKRLGHRLGQMVFGS